MAIDQRVPGLAGATRFWKVRPTPLGLLCPPNQYLLRFTGREGA
jgi:hypothetical protein